MYRKNVKWEKLSGSVEKSRRGILEGCTVKERFWEVRGCPLWKKRVEEEESFMSKRVGRWEKQEGSEWKQKICPKIPPFWEEKVGGEWGMGPTLFSFPIFFPLPFSLLPSRGKCSPLPPFPSPFSFLSHFPPKQADANIEFSIFSCYAHWKNVGPNSNPIFIH